MAHRRRKGPIMTLFKLAFTLAMLFALVYAFLFAYLLVREHNVPAPGNTQAIIVLGAQVNPDGQPSRQLEMRLLEALKAYEAAPKPVIVSGAQGKDEPVTEASVMKSWLEQKGVDPQHILMEDKSFNTRQNLENAKALLGEGVKNVLIITSDYHLPRALDVARDAGLDPSGIGSPILPEYWLKNHARETLAWGKYYVNKFLPFVPID